MQREAQSRKMDEEKPLKQAEEEESIFVVHEIDNLQEHGINVADINKLKAVGLHTVTSVIMTTRRELLNIKGMADNKIDKIMEVAAKICGANFSPATSVLEKRLQVLKITTGSHRFDELLKGGIESQAITEIYGEYRTGKTQLCHTLAVAAQMGRDQRGGQGRVLYIDSDNNL